MNNPVPLMEGTKEDGTAEGAAKDSVSATPESNGGRKKKSSWPHSVISAKVAKGTFTYNVRCTQWMGAGVPGKQL